MALWLPWFRDYAETARRFVAEGPVNVTTDEEAEMVAVKSALYARVMTLFGGALLLIEHDRQLDFRVQAGGGSSKPSCI